MNLLIEFGVEELPAIPFLKEIKNFDLKWQKALDEFGIKGKFEINYTPRRIVISGQIPQFTPDIEIENIGAPKSIALKDGKWTKAAESFANKYYLSLDKLEFKEIGGKEVLYFKSLNKGKPTKEILPIAMLNFLNSLNFGKSMRWGRGEFEFIRPLRSLICMLDNEDLGVEIFGVKSQKAFYPHRDFGYEKIKFDDINEYFSELEKHGVMLKSNDRMAKISADFLEIQIQNNIKIQIDSDLLNEVTAITENPVALFGSFDESFLEVPSEVIITSMKENQRYFPVEKNGKLSNHFVVVSNSSAKNQDLIIKGNEKVLKARLSDAKFFWESDLRAEFNAEKLKNITYLDGLGSMYDKELRECEIAQILAKIYSKELQNECGEDYLQELKKAVMLSKADLTTQMVYEFTDLQGIMGSYYAKSKGQSEFVANAIKEQYLPTGEQSECPKNLFSSIVAICGKLDSLMGLFSINKIPSGNKDPYALRRAATGIIKIVLNMDLSFDIKEISSKIAKNYKKFDLKILQDFIFDRLFTMYEVNSSVISACLSSGESDIKKLNLNIKALDEIVKSSEFDANFDTFKRLANILKDSKIGKIDEKLFEDESEKALFEAFNALELDLNKPKKYLNNLFGLKNEIDKFFESVMINHENPKIKANRIALIGQIYNAFLKIADIKEISV